MWKMLNYSLSQTRNKFKSMRESKGFPAILLLVCGEKGKPPRAAMTYYLSPSSVLCPFESLILLKIQFHLYWFPVTSLIHRCCEKRRKKRKTKTQDDSSMRYSCSSRWKKEYYFISASSCWSFSFTLRNNDITNNVNKQDNSSGH